MQSIAIGDGSQATGLQSIAIGTHNKVTGKHSGAIGDPSTVASDNSYTIGNNNTVSKGSNNVMVLGNGVKVSAGHEGAVVLGNNSTIEKAHEGAYTLGGTHDDKVAGRRGQGTQVVSVGSKGGERQIQNVAPGVISDDSTDAVNGSQLHALGYKLAGEIDDVGDQASAGTAGAMAMTSIPQAYLPGKSMLSGAAAHYGGESAVSIGVSKLSDNGRWVIKANGSADTQGKFGVAVGAGMHF